VRNAKEKPEPRPITAQVPDYCAPFGVDQRGKEHQQQFGAREMVSDGERTQAPGCYRRLPTCAD